MEIVLEVIGSQSLKDKRMVIRSLKDRIRNSFNVSIAEVDDLDCWQKATLAVSCVSNDKKIIESMLSKIIDIVEEDKDALILDVKTETL